MPNGVWFGFPRKASLCSLPQNSCEKLRHTEITLIGFKYFILHGYAGHACGDIPAGQSLRKLRAHVPRPALAGLVM